MSNNQKPSIEQRFSGRAASIHNIKHTPTTYFYTARVINNVGNEANGKVIITARNGQTGKLIMNISQNLKDVRANGLNLPGLNQLCAADGGGRVL